MRKPIIAFIIALIAISVLISSAYGFNFGFTGVGASSGSGGSYALYNNHTLTLPDGFYARVSAMNFYVGNDSANMVIHGAVYDANLAFIAETSNISVNGEGWYTNTINASLFSGMYYLAVGYTDGTIWFCQTGTESDGWCTNGYGFAANPVLSDWDDNAVSMFLTYEILAFEGETIVEHSDVATSQLLTFGGLLILSIVCILLTWKSSIPILNFVVGVVTLGTAAYFLGTNIVFAGWINILAILMASLCMLSGGIKLRNA